jgi:hypothetical protein
VLFSRVIYIRSTVSNPTSTPELKKSTSTAKARLACTTRARLVN